MKRITVTILSNLLIFFLLSIIGFSQDTLKVYAGFSNQNVSVHREPVDFKGQHQQVIKGVDGSLSIKVFRYDNIKAEATAEYSGHFQRGGNNNQFLAGPQLSADYFNKHVTPFVRATFGTTYVFGTHLFTKDVGGGVDVTFGKVGFRPFQVDYQWANFDQGKFNYPIRSTRVGFGAFAKF